MYFLLDLAEIKPSNVLFNYLPIFNWLDKIHEKKKEWLCSIVEVKYTKKDSINTVYYKTYFMYTNNSEYITKNDSYLLYTPFADENYTKTIQDVTLDLFLKEYSNQEIDEDEEYTKQVTIKSVGCLSIEGLQQYLITLTLNDDVIIRNVFDWIHQLIFLNVYTLEMYVKDIIEFDLIRNICNFKYHTFKHPLLTNKNMFVCGYTYTPPSESYNNIFEVAYSKYSNKDMSLVKSYIAALNNALTKYNNEGGRIY